ncbi:MAG TPA: AMP-binding protein, partial [Acidimicrobiales bacterium]|nr:AMP-binding protein [Acidimicrobiales bacterium]
MAEVYASALGIGPGDVFYGPLPMHHLSGTIVAPLVPLVAGASTVVDPVFSVSRFWPRVHEVGATHTVLVGGMPQMLWQRPVDELEAGNPLRAAVAIPVPAEIHDAFERRFGLTIVAGYGSSEAGQVTFSSVDEPVAPGTAGRPMPSHEVMVVDDGDTPVPAGEVGEIVVRPRRPHVMFEEYRGNPEATVAATRNLWFHTGDLGRFDGDGNLTFADRKKDYLRRRGENISSFEVETAMATHPAVAEIAVVGVPSELGEDEVKAYVVLRDGAPIGEVELLHHAARTMPHFAVPRYISILGSLPRSAVGRVQKFLLRDMHSSAPGWDREQHGYSLNRHNIDEFISDPGRFSNAAPGDRRADTR